MTKTIKVPFATQGDRTSIPDEVQADGAVSYAQGYGYDYERDQVSDPAAKDIEREKMNGIFHDITEAVGEVQNYGFPKWAEEGKPYPIRAIVYHKNKVWQSKVENNEVEPVAGAQWAELKADLTAGDINVYNKTESDKRFQPLGNYQAAGYSYSKAESDTNYQPKGNYAPAANYAMKGDSYTKAEGDGRYQPKGSYQPAGNYAVKGESYTKSEEDGRFQPKGNYAPAGDYATKEELEGKLAKDLNGADIPDKPTFINNLGLYDIFADKISSAQQRFKGAVASTSFVIFNSDGDFSVIEKETSGVDSMLILKTSKSIVYIPEKTGVLAFKSDIDDTVPVGTIIFVAHNNQIKGRYLRVNGAVISRTTYAELFNAIGTTYGAGDGNTTFNLPDYRDYFPRFAGENRSVGSKQGDEIRNITGYAGFDADIKIGTDLGALSVTRGTVYSYQRSNNKEGITGVSFNADNQVPTADENRPKNIAIAGWIKY